MSTRSPHNNKSPKKLRTKEDPPKSATRTSRRVSSDDDSDNDPTSTNEHTTEDSSEVSLLPSIKEPKKPSPLPNAVQTPKINRAPTPKRKVVAKETNVSAEKKPTKTKKFLKRKRDGSEISESGNLDFSELEESSESTSSSSDSTTSSDSEDVSGEDSSDESSEKKDDITEKNQKELDEGKHRKSKEELPEITIPIKKQSSSDTLEQTKELEAKAQDQPLQEAEPENPPEVDRFESEFDQVPVPITATAIGKAPLCLVAKSTLIIPVDWMEPAVAQASKFVLALLSRKLVDRKEKEINLWKINHRLPVEVFDLDQHFRSQLGCSVNTPSEFREENKSGPRLTKDGKTFQEDDEKVWRLELTGRARRLLFGKLKLRAYFRQRESEQKKPTQTGTSNQDSKGTKKNKNDGSTKSDAKSKVPPKPPIQQVPKIDFLDPDNDPNLDLYYSGRSHRFSIVDDDQFDSYYAKRPNRMSFAEDPRKEEKPIVSLLSVPVTQVNVVIYPYGTALLQFHLDWLPKGPESLTLDELRTWLFLAKTLRSIPGVFDGWLLSGTDYLINYNKVLPEAHIKSIGPRLCSSLYESKPISLVTLAHILMSIKDDVTGKTQYAKIGTRCYHHTTVVVNQKLEGETFNEFFFHLRRAKGQLNRPPPSSDSGESLLQPRKNRHIGICREGIVSLSWPVTNSLHDYERTHWPDQFQGIYRVLAVHVHGEKLILSALSQTTSSQGKRLHILCGDVTSASELKRVRRKMLSYMTLVSQYTLQMSADDCGGYTEYVQFFTATRKVLGIKKQRNELTVELREVASLLESNFNEEHQKLEAIDRFHKQTADRRNSRTQSVFAILTAVAIPLAIVSGIFGMNNLDLPSQVSWKWLIMGSCIASILIIILYFTIIVGMKENDQKREEKMIKKIMGSKMKKRDLRKLMKSIF